jgi:hypothetical protein
MQYTSVPFDAAARNMLSLDTAREVLGRTEPLAELTFRTGDPGLELTASAGWESEEELTAPVPVWLRMPDGLLLQLTKQAALEVGSTCRINQRYQQSIPPDLYEANVNWWLQRGLGGDRELKLLTAGTGADPDGKPVPVAVAQTRATVDPFSNLRLLEVVLEGVERRFGAEAVLSACVDYKFWHDLEHTGFRVVFPAVQEVVDGTRVDDDAWCYGVQVSNSIIGLKQTAVHGYLFRFVCTNGMTDTAHSAGGFQRRGSTPDDAYEWAARTVDDVLGGLEEALNGVRALTGEATAGTVVTVLNDLFREHHIPKAQQNRIIETMADTGGFLTMYDVTNALTRAANLEGLDWRAVDQLLMVGGDIARSMGSRCDGSLPSGCHRLLPVDWEDLDTEV